MDSRTHLPNDANMNRRTYEADNASVFSTNTTDPTYVNQQVVDPNAARNADGSLNTDSIYGNKSRAEPLESQRMNRANANAPEYRGSAVSGNAPNATALGGPNTYGTNADMGANQLGSQTGFVQDAQGGTAYVGPNAAANMIGAPVLGTGHSTVSLDVGRNPAVLQQPNVTATSTSKATTVNTNPSVPIGSAGRVLMVLSSATPAIYKPGMLSSMMGSAENKKSGYFWDEVALPYNVYTEAGYAVDFVSETGSASPDENSLQGSYLSSEGKKVWTNKEHPIHQQLSSVRQASTVDANNYNIIFFAGGHAAAYDLPNAPVVQGLAARVYEKGGVVAAVCHGTAVFKGIRLSNGQYLANGRRLTGFSTKGEEKMGMVDQLKGDNVPTMQEVVTGAGGKWEEHDKDFNAEYVIDDNRVVTGMNPASAAGVARKSIELDNFRSGRTGGMGTGVNNNGAYDKNIHHHHHTTTTTQPSTYSTIA